MFYLDAGTKTIKSVAYKNQSWDIQNSGQTTNMQIWKTNGRWFQMFKLVGDRIQNERGQFVGVQNSSNVVVGKSTPNNWWRWNVSYARNEQTYQTGEYHPGYGLYCNKAFHIVSKRDGRYLEATMTGARNVLVKTRNSNKGQQWTFNCNAEVITAATN
jgi:hypothetical protein